jgi:hypothetical protein
VNVFQGIWRDLIDKRLWPYALALVVLIVAVPTVLARTGGSPADEVPEGAVIAGAASVQGPRDAVVVEADPAETPTAGRMRNPFYEPPDPDKSSEASPDGAGAETTGSGGGSGIGKTVESAAMPGGAPGEPGGDDTGASTGSGGSSGGSKDSTGGTTTKSSTGSGENGYDVSLRFGTEDGMKSFKAVPRLTPLPSADTPSFVYLGVLSGGKTAVFMIAVDVTAVGDGTCRPSRTVCETLEMKAGETMFLDVPGEDGQVTQYQLDVTSITKVGKGGNTLAAEEAGRSATGSSAASDVEAGEDAVRRARKTRAKKTLDRYRFVRSRGVMVRSAAPKARAARGGGLRARATGRVVAGGL